MAFVFDYRASDSQLVEAIWHSQHFGGGSFMSQAATNMEIVVTKQVGKLTRKLLKPTLFVPMTGKALKEGPEPKAEEPAAPPGGAGKEPPKSRKGREGVRSRSDGR